jgi:outer membrane protein
MHRTLLAGSLAGVTALIAAENLGQNAADILTLKQALQLSQEHNRQIANATLALAISNDKIAQAQTYRFPQLNLYALGAQLLTPIDFNFQRGAFGTYSAVGPIPATDTSIETPRRFALYGAAQLVQPISQLYKIGLKVEMAKVGRSVEAEKLRAQRQATVQEVKQTYYGIVQTQRAVVASGENVDFAREFDRIAEKNLAENAALKSDSLEAHAKVAEAEYNDASLRDGFASRKEQLNALIGRPIGADFTVEQMPTPIEEELSLDAARSNALTSRPDLRQSKLGLQYAELNRRVAKADYIPDVSLSVSNLRTQNVDFLPNNVSSAGVLVQWDVFDWGRRRKEVAAAAKGLSQAQNTAADAEDQAMIEVGIRFRKLQQNRLLLRASELQLNAEQEKLRVAMNALKQDFALRKDVLGQRTAVKTADARYQQALAGFWTARAEFEKAVGKDEP